MRKIVVEKNDAGQRLDKFLSGFHYIHNILVGLLVGTHVFNTKIAYEFRK